MLSRCSHPRNPLLRSHLLHLLLLPWLQLLRLVLITPLLMLEISVSFTHVQSTTITYHNPGSSASVKSVELPDLIEVQDSNDGEDAGSVKEDITVEEDDDAKLCTLLTQCSKSDY